MNKIKWTMRSEEVSIGTWRYFSFVVVKLTRDTYRVFKFDRLHSVLRHIPFPQPDCPFPSMEKAQENTQLWVDSIVEEIKNDIT